MKAINHTKLNNSRDSGIIFLISIYEHIKTKKPVKVLITLLKFIQIMQRLHFTLTNKKNTMKTINHTKLERSGDCALIFSVSIYGLYDRGVTTGGWGGSSPHPQPFCSCNKVQYFQAKFILLIVHIV